MVIRILLFFVAILLCSDSFSERPVPNVITGGNPTKKSVQWPTTGEYRAPQQTERPTGSTFYERAYVRVYYKPEPYCAAHRRQVYPSYGNTRYVRR